MADTVADIPETPKSKGKPGLILWLALALAGAGAGFAAVSLGMIPLGGASGDHTAASSHAPSVKGASDVEFIEIDPIMISLSGGTTQKQLKFRAQLEVMSTHARDVERIIPRVVDIMNSYLRALSLDDLRDTMALVRLRSQLLRRIEIVAGEGVVKDLLVMEFVLN